MALSVAFIGANNYESSAEDVRNLVKAMLPGSGIIDGFAVSPATGAGLSVGVNPGHAVLEGQAASQGSYLVWSPTRDNVPWPAPSPSPRIDALVLAVADSQYGAVIKQGPSWLIVKGTPAAQPGPPSDETIAAQAPAGAWARVANVTVQPGATRFEPADIHPAGGTRGMWRPLTLPSKYLPYKPEEYATPSYRVHGAQVHLRGAIWRADGDDMHDADLSGTELARVGPEVIPRRRCLGFMPANADVSTPSKPLIGGIGVRGEVRPDGVITGWKWSDRYQPKFVNFDGFTYWID